MYFVRVQSVNMETFGEFKYNNRFVWLGWQREKSVKESENLIGWTYNHIYKLTLFLPFVCTYDFLLNFTHSALMKMSI